MPQFSPNQSKNAIVPATVQPGGLSCELEVFLGPNESTKVVTSGLKAFTSTGAQQSVAAPVVMPSASGTYHVYIDLYAAGYYLVGYQAIEDVVIAPSVGEFVYGSPSAVFRNFSEIDPYASWITFYLIFSCMITNQGSAQGIRTVDCLYQQNLASGPGSVKVITTQVVSLNPGETYNFAFGGTTFLGVYPNTSATPSLFGYWFWLRDNTGQESAKVYKTNSGPG